MARKAVAQCLKFTRREKMLGSRIISPLIVKPYQSKLIGLFYLWEKCCVSIKEIFSFDGLTHYAA